MIQALKDLEQVVGRYGNAIGDAVAVGYCTKSDAARCKEDIKDLYGQAWDHYMNMSPMHDNPVRFRDLGMFIHMYMYVHIYAHTYLFGHVP